MITTRDIDVSRNEKTPKKLKQKTTKEIEVKNLGQDEPLEPAAGPMVTTHNMEKIALETAKKEKKAKAVEERKAKVAREKAKKDKKK